MTNKMMQDKKALILALLLWLSYGHLLSCAFGAILRLKDGKTIEARIEHYFDGVFTLVTADGTRSKVLRTDIRSIDFEANPTPAKTESTQTQTEPLPLSPPPPSLPENFLNSLPKGDTRYSTPVATFNTWREAAIRNDIDAMVNCYVSYRRKAVRDELRKLPKEKREEMRATTAQMEFVPGKPLYNGERAVLEVNWQKGIYGDNPVLQFALEGNDWKIIQ